MEVFSVRAQDGDVTLNDEMVYSLYGNQLVSLNLNNNNAINF